MMDCCGVHNAFWDYNQRVGTVVGMDERTENLVTPNASIACSC